MLNTKNHISIVLGTNLGNVVEIKANIVKFPYGEEKAVLDDLSNEDIESISFITSSVNIVDKEFSLRNESNGSTINIDEGKTLTVAQLKENIYNFNDGLRDTVDIFIPELNYPIIKEKI